MNIFILKFLVEVIFGTIIFLHLTKKNFGSAIAYGLQSLAIMAILLEYYFETGNSSLLFMAGFVCLVKVVIAPIFFIKLIQKHHLTFSVSTYLNTPLTFILIAVLTFLAHSQRFFPLTNIVPAHQPLLALALSSLFLSLFLMINRKGALSQMIGILSLENSMVVFTMFAGLEQSLALQLGIIFNIFIWLMIATVFVSMMYTHFGSLDVSSMKNLKD